jgi:glutamine synthetase adenylyltransferase
MFQVVYEEWERKAGNKAKDAGRDKELHELADYLNLQPYTQRQHRLQLMVKAVESLSRRPSPEAAKRFTEYVSDIGNPKLLDEMVRNDFLTDLVRTDPVELSKKTQTPPLVNELQALSDKELQHGLEKLSAYRPDEFKKRLEAVCAKLPPAPAKP